MEHAPEAVRWEVATDLACCLKDRSCEESIQSLAAWYGSLWALFPVAVVAFVSSVSASDLDQSFHVLKVLEVLTDSSAEQVKSAVGAQKRRPERWAAMGSDGQALTATDTVGQEWTGINNDGQQWKTCESFVLRAHAAQV